jgi:hypothetical protein
MALIPSARYPAQSDTGDAGYPQGKARNAATFQDGTGTPQEKAWINDLWGFEQALLAQASIVPSGDPDQVGASQYLDAILALVASSLVPVESARRRALALGALHLRQLDVTVDDTSDSMAATMVDGVLSPTVAAVLAKADSTGVVLAYDSPLVARGGVLGAGVTSVVRDAASNGSRILVVGDDGSGVHANRYSDNAGSSWSASSGGGGLPLYVKYVVYCPPNALAGGGNRFIAASETTSAVFRSADGATWASSGFSAAGMFGLAVVGGATAAKGYVVGLVNDGTTLGIQPRFTLATDGTGAAFTGSVAPPSAATAEEPGSLAGAPRVAGVGDYIYHVMRCNGGARLRTAKSIDGSTWVAGTAIQGAASGVSFSGTPRLMICQSSGLMVIAVPLNTGAMGLYASLDFVEWVGPVVVEGTATTAFAVAGGKLFMTSGARLYASDGIRMGL